MIDHIVLGSNEISLFIIAMSLLMYVLATLLFFFLMYFLAVKFTNFKNTLIAKICTVLVLGILINVVYSTTKTVGDVAVSNQELMTLLQAESTIIQIQEVELPKNSAAIDNEKANQWIKNMRSYVEKGYVTRAEYISISNQFNELNIGRENFKKMIAENNTDKVRTQIRQALSQQALADQQRLVEQSAQQKVNIDSGVEQSEPTRQ